MVSSQPAVSVPGKRHTEPKSYSQTCLGHVTAQPRVQLLLESFTDDKRQQQRNMFFILVSVSPNSRLFVQVNLH